MSLTNTRRGFIAHAAGALALQQVSRTARADDDRLKLEPFEYSGVRLLESRFQTQFQSARDFYFNIAADDLLLGFRQRAGLPAPGKPLIGWYGGTPEGLGRKKLAGGDTFHAFGQYLSGMSRMAQAANDTAMKDKVGELISEWAKTIEPDGFFYYSRQPYSPHYIYEKTVCGLVDAFTFCGNREAIAHLERITAWAEKNLDRTRPIPLHGVSFGADGQEWYTLPENLYRAWQLTGDARYRNFAALWHYPDYWGMFNGTAGLNPYGRHAYSHVNTLSSAAMAYYATRDPAHLKTITGAYDWLQKTQVYASGGFGPSERLVKPDGTLGKELEFNANTFETVCGSWAIFKLCRYLISFTGQARYGDWIENALYNGIGASLPMQADGRNFYYSDYRLGGGRKIYNALWRWSCCSGTYPQSIADFHNIIYFRSTGALHVNLYVPSEVQWNGITLRQETAYPEAASSKFTVRAGAATRFALRFRIPGWCQGASITVNGRKDPAACRPGEWASVERTWKDGDQVAVELPIELRRVPVDSRHPQRVALVYGPVVLAKRQQSRLASPVEAIKRRGSGLVFAATEAESKEFVPFYAFHLDEPYEMYFDLAG